MKTSILITSSGVAKLIPNEAEAPYRYPLLFSYKKPLREYYAEEWYYQQNVKAYENAFTALEKEAESWPEFEDGNALVKYLPRDKALKLVGLGEVEFVPGIYKEVEVPEYRIVHQYKAIRGHDAGQFFDILKHEENNPLAEGYEYRQVIRFLPETASEPKCGDCGKELTLVRPGKHQCDNSDCEQNRVTNSEGEQKPFFCRYINEDCDKQCRECNELYKELESIDKGDVVGDPAVKESKKEVYDEIRQIVWDHLNKPREQKYSSIAAELEAKFTISRK